PPMAIPAMTGVADESCFGDVEGGGSARIAIHATRRVRVHMTGGGPALSVSPVTLCPPSAAARRADPRYTNTATSTARTTAAKRVAASREAPRREVRSDGIVRKRGSAERRAETLPQLSGRPAREQS